MNTSRARQDSAERGAQRHLERPEPLPRQRHLFDLPDGLAYLNCAYMAPQLRSVTAAGEAAVTRKATPWEILPSDFFREVDLLREQFARLIGGDADGVAIVPSVAYGTSTAAANLVVDPDTEIVVLAEQFPSNVYPWRALASVMRARLRTVPRAADHDWTAALLEVIGDRTAVVAVPACHWTDGTVVDLVRVGAAARAVGAAFVVDGTQAVGATPLDVQAIQPDFLVTACYKWLLGPYSIGFMWAHPSQREGRPIEHGWSSRAGSEDFARLVDYRDTYRPGARRYDVGETANFVLVPMALAALDQLLAWGVDRIAATCRVLTDAVADAASQLGLGHPQAIVRSPHLIGLTLPAHLVPAQVAAQLEAESVHVSVRGASVRVSPHVYNDLDDVARLAGALAAASRPAATS